MRLTGPAPTADSAGFQPRTRHVTHSGGGEGLATASRKRWYVALVQISSKEASFRLPMLRLVSQHG